jgi:hypothetical protein
MAGVFGGKYKSDSSNECEVRGSESKYFSQWQGNTENYYPCEQPLLIYITSRADSQQIYSEDGDTCESSYRNGRPISW